jgi:GNAT superfamily N-acetyltransferase
MSSTMFTIVRAQHEHLALVVPLFDAYRVFYKQPSDPARAHDFLEQRLHRGDSVIFVALRGDSGLGFTQLYPSFSSVATQRIWILNDLFVAPDARGQGVAQALLRHAQHWGHETHGKRLVLSTAINNAAAQRVYEKLGWQRDTAFYHYELALDQANSMSAGQP